MFSNTIKLAIGWTAFLCSLLYKIPQLYRIYKYKKGEDISYKSLVIQTSSYVLWIVYSVEINDMIYIYSNIFSLVLNISMMYMKQYYSNQFKLQQTPIQNIDSVKNDGDHENDFINDFINAHNEDDIKIHIEMNENQKLRNSLRIQK